MVKNNIQLNRVDASICAALFLIFNLIGIGFILSRPDLMIHRTFISDEGTVLSAVDTILAGGLIYKMSSGITALSHCFIIAAGRIFLETTGWFT